MSRRLTGIPDPRTTPTLTVAETAVWLGVGEKAVRKACDAGELPVIRIGRYVRIPTHQLLVQLGMPADSGEAEPAKRELAALDTSVVT